VPAFSYAVDVEANQWRGELREPCCDPASTDVRSASLHIRQVASFRLGFAAPGAAMQIMPVSAQEPRNGGASSASLLGVAELRPPYSSARILPFGILRLR